MGNDGLTESGEKIQSILFITVFIAVMLLAVGITLTALSNANDSFNGNVTQTITIINETGFANSTGYTLAYTNIARTSTPVLTQLINRTSQTIIGLGNATVSSTGIVTNATATVWNNLSITYTYVKDITNSTTTNSAITNVRNDVLSMAGNFFALMPTIGTIMAVVVLIAGIVILVLYVNKMRRPQEGYGYTG